MHPQFQPLVNAFLKWASARHEVRAAVVIGSQARAQRAADAFSDLDLVIVTADPHYFLEEDGWLKTIGTPIVSFRELRATGGEFERRVLFEPDRDVDFIPVSTAEWAAWMSGQVSPQVLQIFALGHRVIFDRAGDVPARLCALCHGVSAGEALPDESAFQGLCGDYLYHGLWTAKKLRRGELFTAKACLDGHMKRALLTLIEWHVRLNQPQEARVCSRGRFLEQWAPPWVQDRLRASFAAYDSADLKRALGASMEFFQQLGVEVARDRGYAYPSGAHARIRRLIDERLGDA